MKKPLALAGLSLFVLIGAAYPDAPQLHYGAAVLAGTSEVTGPTYRPCRRDPRDDRCIQLYERGVRTAYAQWLSEHGVGGPDTNVADAPRRDRARPHRRARMAMARAHCLPEAGTHDPRQHREMRMHDRHRAHGGHDSARPPEHGRPENSRPEHREHRDHLDGEVRGM